MSEKMGRVFVVGSVNMDLVIGSERQPKIGETIRGSGFFTNAGGKGANQAVAARRSGAGCVFCAAVGDDMFGKILREGLEGYKVDTRFVQAAANTPSGVAVINVVGGNNCIILGEGANGTLDEQSVAACLSEAEAGDILLVQLEIPAKTVLFALKTGKEKGMVTILNPAPAQGFDAAYLPYTDIITPNETESEFLSGEKDPKAAAALLAEKVGCVIVTAGGAGCILSEGGQTKAYPCPKVKAVDTTAAGDTFCGAFAARLAKGETKERAIGYALSAASLAVTARGAQQSIPDEEAVARFMRENR